MIRRIDNTNDEDRTIVVTNPSWKDSMEAQLHSLYTIEKQIVELEKIKESLIKLAGTDLTAIENAGKDPQAIEQISRNIGDIKNLSTRVEFIDAIGNDLEMIRNTFNSLDQIKSNKDDFCFMKNKTKQQFDISSAAYAKINRLYNRKLHPDILKIESNQQELKDQLIQAVKTIGEGHEKAVKFMTYDILINVCENWNYENNHFMVINDEYHTITYNIPRPFCATNVDCSDECTGGGSEFKTVVTVDDLVPVPVEPYKYIFTMDIGNMREATYALRGVTVLEKGEGYLDVEKINGDGFVLDKIGDNKFGIRESLITEALRGKAEGTIFAVNSYCFFKDAPQHYLYIRNNNIPNRHNFKLYKPIDDTVEINLTLSYSS